MEPTVIEVTVKTLDSQNHQFSVPEDMLVRRFKTLISGTIGIPEDQQRLIFRGRVLQDQQKMSDYNVANNTVHVVQRPSNANPNRNNDEPSRTADRTGGDGGGGAGGPNTIIMGTIGFPMDMQGGASRPRTRNSAAYRIQVGNQMLGQASSLLRLLEAEDSVAQTLESAAVAAAGAAGGASDDNSATEDEDGGGMEDESPMDIDMDDPNAISRMISQLANAHSATAVVASVRPVQDGGSGNASAGATGGGPSVSVAAERIQHQPSIVNIPVGIRGGPDTPNRPRPEAPRLREMSTLIQDILAFQQRLLPYLRYVENVLQSNRLYQNQDEIESTQYVYETVSSIMHYLSHSFHALSDIMCDFSTPPESRRLRAPTSVLIEQSTVLRATIPFHAGMVSQNQQQPPAAPPAPIAPPTNASQPSPISRPPQQQNPPPATGVHHHQFPMFPGLSGGTFGQAQLNIGGGAGGLPFNFGQAFQVAAGSGGNQPGTGSFVIPDLSNILGPNIAANVMNLASASAQAGLNAAMAANNGRTSEQQQPTPPPQPTATQQTRSSASTGGGATTTQQPQTPTPAPAAGVGATAPQQHNHHIRGGVEYGHRPFDVILSCNSHHNAERSRRPNRPANLRRHIQVESSSTGNEVASPSQDFLLNLIDFLRNSNLLTILLPIFKDIITNYLMRGRDMNNQGHIKSCAKSLSKIFSQTLTTFANQIPERMPGVQYAETFSALVTNFFFNIIELTIRPPVDGDYKRAVLMACEKHLMDLMDLLKFCLSKDQSYLPRFIKLLLDTVVSGTPTIFRENVAINLRDYFTNMPSQVDTTGFVPPCLIRTGQPDIVPSSSSASTVAASGPVRPKEETRSPLGVPPKQPRPTVPQSMDEDIDEMLELNSARRTDGSGDPSASGTGVPQIDTAFRNLPTDWRDQVRVDLQRQLVMPDQPPFSNGYSAIFSRNRSQP